MATYSTSIEEKVEGYKPVMSYFINEHRKISGLGLKNQYLEITLRPEVK